MKLFSRAWIMTPISLHGCYWQKISTLKSVGLPFNVETFEFDLDVLDDTLTDQNPFGLCWWCEQSSGHYQ